MEIDRRIALTAGLTGVAALMATPGHAQTYPRSPGPRIKPLQVQGLSIGEGRPKVIVSIAEPTPEAALARAHALAAIGEIDMIEYRVDHLTDHAEADHVAASVAAVRDACAGKPLLMTFRTKAEGGVAAIDPDAYARLYAAALDRKAADLIDLQQALCTEPSVAGLFRRAKASNVPVILSYHNFQGTPSVEAMVATLRAMQQMGAAIPKIAVMPRDADDTLKLLQATWEMHSRFADRPLLTMSMGGTGAISRVSGQTFGSALTFGAVGTVSAPGQIAVDKLAPVLETLFETLR